MITIITILSILLLVSGLIIWNLYNQTQQLSEFVEKYNKRETKLYQELETHYQIFLKLFTEASLELSRVDKRGSFSSDDEVGFAFKTIVRAIETVKSTLIDLRDDEEVND